ncbi:hypothetical protein [Streptomyces sp. NK08204]|uniref:hypothetical protein n=1 Tax=Streptomyces sp. NK08204 TaxID=2873260 RepID=UPI0027E238FC|nr:hypothetical protein [Streptomyces sp. NK08204]
MARVAVIGGGISGLGTALVLGRRGRRAAALAACAFDDPVVMRARAQVRHLLQPADDACGTDEVDRAVTDWLAARPGFSPAHDGPTRDQRDALIPG